MKSDENWWEYHYNILALARELHKEKGLDIEGILYLMEKPWKYSKEWKQLKIRGDEEE